MTNTNRSAEIFTIDNIATQLLDIYSRNRISHIIFQSRFQRLIFDNSTIIKYLFLLLFLISVLSFAPAVHILLKMSLFNASIFYTLATLLCTSIVGQILCHSCIQRLKSIQERLGFQPSIYHKTYFLLIIPEITITEYTKDIYALQADKIFKECIALGILHDNKRDIDFFQKCKDVFESKELNDLSRKRSLFETKKTQAFENMLDIKLY